MFGGVVQFWSHDSELTKTKMKFSTFIPDGKLQGCLIWLSGLTCTEENFITKAGAQRRLSDHHWMVICPDTSPRGLQLPGEHDADDFGSGASFYVNANTEGYRNHYRMYDYISIELHQLIQKQFGLGQNQISISGHSMGGHGALVLGLREPQKFQSVSAFSPIVHPCEAPWGKKAFQGYLGEDRQSWLEYDATELILRGRKHPQSILIDQGTADPFLKTQLLTDHFMTVCKSQGQATDIRWREGCDHSYYFISTFIDSHIDFHAKHQKI